MQDMAELLLQWYQKNKRDLPWRIDKNPYHIWISEIMLQQTRVEAVKNYYLRFLKEIPTVLDLARVEEDKLLKLWEGLGYYTRARNLKVAAEQIVTNYQGKFPTTYKELLNLKGIGEYTAGAIASIAFQEKVPAVDGNVIRVMLRLKNSRRSPSEVSLKKEIFRELQNIMPDNPGDFNQAMMDLGATVCVPNTYPNCSVCPFQSFCQANFEHNTLNVPIKGKKQTKKVEKYTIVIFSYQGKFAIQKRPMQGLLAGMYEFYTISGLFTLPKLKTYLESQGIVGKSYRRLGEEQHVFTHRMWKMQGYLVEVSQAYEHFHWVDFLDLQEHYSIPSAFQYYLEKIRKI